MKTKALFLLLTYLFLSFLPDKGGRTDWSEMNLKGKVKMLKELQYEATEKAGKVKKGEYIGWAHSWFFNDKGYKTEERLSDPDGTDATKAIFSYDNKWRKTEVNTFHSDGKPNLKISSKYDSKGFEIERNINDLNGGTDNWRTTYKYDKKGFKIEEMVQHRQNEPSRVLYKYEKSLLIETEQLQPDGNPVVKRNYKYDKEGNKIEMTNSVRGILKNSYSYKYEFDKTGNWIRQTEFEGGKINAITEREITYY
jgi:hypothetical protein